MFVVVYQFHQNVVYLEIIFIFILPINFQKIKCLSNQQKNGKKSKHTHDAHDLMLNYHHHHHHTENERQSFSWQKYKRKTKTKKNDQTTKYDNTISKFYFIILSSIFVDARKKQKNKKKTKSLGLWYIFTGQYRKQKQHFLFFLQHGQLFFFFFLSFVCPFYSCINP